MRESNRATLTVLAAVASILASCAAVDPGVPWDIDQMARELTRQLPHSDGTTGDLKDWEVLAWRVDERREGHGTMLQSDVPVLMGPYLGQKPPGTTAQQFAASVFDSSYQGFHSNIIFSPDGREAYWQLNEGHGSRRQAIFESRYEGRIWTKPQVAFFSALVAGGLDDAPFISPDGKRFFFLSYRPIQGGDKFDRCNIWMMERTGKRWSEPRSLPQIVNALEGIHWMLSVDMRGNLYFGTWQPREGGNTTGDIYCSKYEDGQYTRPQKLGPEINAAGYNYSPFIAPDGSYVIFSRKEPSKPAKLFICFRKSDGIWTTARDLSGNIGRYCQDTDLLCCDCPVVTADGKYLFFRGDVAGRPRPFWVEAGFIEELRRSVSVSPR